MKFSRRAFIETTTSAGLVIPAVGSQVLLGCTNQADKPAAVPSSRPADWDPVDFNVKRGRAGLIPADYMEQIEGTDGIAKHLGKHLPYVPELADVDDGWIPIMWGDPAKGFSAHPNAPQSATNPEGHWYDWIRVSLDGEPSSEIESTYDGWPMVSGSATGRLVSVDDRPITAEDGKGTVYLAKLPEGYAPGSALRIWAHCLTHGEYVDFVTF